MAARKNAETASVSARADYWTESARPLVSLLFVAPMLLVYEAGVLLQGPRAMRNGADVWLRQLLELIGFGQYFLLPILTTVILLAWHHTTRQQWRCRSGVLGRMLVESLVFGIVLMMIAQLQGSLFAASASAISLATGESAASPNATGLIGHIVGYVGAGIYEELLFRLMLLPTVAASVRLAGGSPRLSIVVAVILTSLVFSAAHYQMFTAAGEPFAWFSFVFRFLAGVFFSLLFLYRGFGIAAGSHTLYDIFAFASAF
jgi:membrane protease YdiL (CAAX protease family)